MRVCTQQGRYRLWPEFTFFFFFFYLLAVHRRVRLRRARERAVDAAGRREAAALERQPAQQDVGLDDLAWTVNRSINQ